MKMESGDFKNYKTSYHEFDYISPIQSTDNDWTNQQPQLTTETPRKRESIKGKKKQTGLTMEWLDENYTRCDGICLPRCILYSHYLDFCKRSNLEPACAATFGKMIRQKFPGITTRRLGTRGHSKYHYYGIGIRETSPYYHAVYSSKGLTRFSTYSASETRNSDISRNIHVKFDANPMTEYPDISKIIQAPSPGIDKYQVEDLLVKHRSNCQNIANVLTQRNFDETRSLMISFWRSLPHHYYALLENELIIDVICLGDSVLHKNLIELLIPVAKENVSESALEEMRIVAKNWEEWEMASLVGISPSLTKKKLAIAHQFAQSVKRQCTFLHLAKTIHNILIEPSKVSAMIGDISKVDLGSIGSQAFYATTESEGQDNELNSELLKDLKDLLQMHAALEQYISWLDSIIEKKVIKPSKQNGRSTKKRAQDFLLKWSFFGARIMHNLTLNSAVSFGSFHALRMLFDEYILFGVETQFKNEKDQELATTVEKHLRKQARASVQYYSDITSPMSKERRLSSERLMTYNDVFQPRPTVINQGYSCQSAFSPFANAHSVNGFFPEVQTSVTSKITPDFAPNPFSSEIIRHPTATYYNHQINPSSSYHAIGGQINYTNVIGEVSSPESAQPSSYVCEGDQIFVSLDAFPSTDVFAPSSQAEVLVPQTHSQIPDDIIPGMSLQNPQSMHQCVPVISTTKRTQSDNKLIQLQYYGMKSSTANDAQTSSQTLSSGSGQNAQIPYRSAAEVMRPTTNVIELMNTYGTYAGTMQTPSTIVDSFGAQETGNPTGKTSEVEFCGELYAENIIADRVSPNVCHEVSTFQTNNTTCSGIDVSFQEYQ